MKNNRKRKTSPEGDTILQSLHAKVRYIWYVRIEKACSRKHLRKERKDKYGVGPYRMFPVDTKSLRISKGPLYIVGKQSSRESR